MIHPTQRLPSPQRRERLLDLSKHRSSLANHPHAEDETDGRGASSANTESAETGDHRCATAQQ
jgi:hypothetical protein